MVTHLERLKKVSDSGSLDREDWLLLQKIISQEQSTLKPCLCQNPCKPGSVMFSKDMKKTFSNRNHAAYGLGEVYIRFKCTAEGCNTSFSAMTLLIRYHERNQAKQTSLGIKRKLSPNTDTPISDSNSNLWSDCVEGLPLSSQPSAPTQNTDAQESQPTQQSQSQSFLVTQLPQYDSQESRSVTHQSRPLTQASQRLASQESINQAILATLGDLVNQIQQLNSRIAVLEKHSSSPSTDGSTGNTVPLTSQRSTSGTALTSSQPSSSNVPAQNTTWASVVSASPSVALQKARVNSQLPARIDGFKALRDLSKKTTRPSRVLNASTTAIYVSGFEFEKYGKIWKALRTARFQTSRIPSLQWIGKTVLEFIVLDTYATQFSSEIQVAGFKVLRDFNPARCNNTLSLEDAATIRRAFTIRCVKNIVFPSNPLACSHFERVFAKARSEDPRLGPLYDAEMQAATQEKASRIDALVSQASASPSPSEEELKLIIKSLGALSPSHELVVAYDAARRANTTPNPPTTDTDTGTIVDVDMIVEENHLLIGNTAAASTLEDGSGDH